MKFNLPGFQLTCVLSAQHLYCCFVSAGGAEFVSHGADTLIKQLRARQEIEKAEKELKKLQKHYVKMLSKGRRMKRWTKRTKRKKTPTLLIFT